MQLVQRRSDKHGTTFPASVIYLYNVSRVVSVLFEDQHGRSVGVNVELFLQIGGL